MPRLTLTPADTTAAANVASPPASGDNTNVALGSFAAVARKAVILSITADYATNVDTVGTAESTTEYSFDGAAWVQIHTEAQSGAGGAVVNNRVDTVDLGNLTTTQMSGLRIRARARANSVDAADSQTNVDTWSASYLTGAAGILMA